MVTSTTHQLATCPVCLCVHACVRAYLSVGGGGLT